MAKGKPGLKRVLLLHPSLLFYKIPIYNKLSDFLSKRGFELIIWYTDIQTENENVAFKNIGDLEMTRANLRRVLKENDIDYVINILFKSIPGYGFYFYSLIYPRFAGCRVIFYGHGINKQKIEPVRVFLYNLIHFLFDRLILYSPGEKKHLWKVHHNKISVANNTLDLEGRREAIDSPINSVKEKLKISHDFIVLFSGRIQGRKKLETLVNVFESIFPNHQKAGLVIIGSGMNSELKERIDKLSNVYYMGPVYEKEKISEIFYISDIFCVPGALGLGIVEALYWGLPVVTTNINHGPEFFYLENGKNSIIVESEEDIGRAIKEIFGDSERLYLLKKEAIWTYDEKATLDKMFEGFIQALK